MVGRRLGGTHVNDCKGANVVDVIFGTHGVEMLNQYREHLHTAINILRVAEELMEVGGCLEDGLLIPSCRSKGAGCRPLVLVGW